MKKVGIFYGSTTGTTESVAKLIASKLGIDASDVHEVSQLSSEGVALYDVLLLGSSTWGDGELQDDWYEGIERLKDMDLSGKIVALFGCGDAESYPDSFCGALGQLYHSLKDKCRLVGAVPVDGYTFGCSEAVVDGQFVGLAIDDVNESNLTDDRVSAWVMQLKPYI